MQQQREIVKVNSCRLDHLPKIDIGASYIFAQRKKVVAFAYVTVDNQLGSRSGTAAALRSEYSVTNAHFFDSGARRVPQVMEV